VSTDEKRAKDRAGAAREAYRRRVAGRARRRRSESQLMRHERERLALGHALRRELASLADGAADLLRAAQGQGRGAERAAVRLAARRRRAQDALAQSERFGIDAGLSELDPPDRLALGLPES
jgi:hypothetical protein